MSESDRPSRGAAILIIEDDDEAATNLQNGLIGAGYVVRRVASGNEAVVTLKSMQADLILMSLMLPDTDGLILCSTVKAHFPAPIIVLSARGGEVDRALAIESGATDCLTKPVDCDELLAHMKAVTVDCPSLPRPDAGNGDQCPGQTLPPSHLAAQPAGCFAEVHARMDQTTLRHLVANIQPFC